MIRSPESALLGGAGAQGVYRDAGVHLEPRQGLRSYPMARLGLKELFPQWIPMAIGGRSQLFTLGGALECPHTMVSGFPQGE